ncbi:MAG: nucleotidyltransferase family protein [Clostridia bacterium]|nr:nucleotidyltransferase family protein [Clostridia bacterium]
MRIAGVVCEYNPFHTGHQHQLAATRLAGADAIVCVMSGNFVQRGEPALISKWTRAEAAVRCGADLVVELPTSCALLSAEGFADNAVSLLLSVGINLLSFGSEGGDAASVFSAAKLLCSEHFEPLLREELALGLPYAAARQRALIRLGGKGELLTNPNDNLAVEYCKALIRREMQLPLFAVQRQGAGHNQPADRLGSSLAQAEAGSFSASALRSDYFETGGALWKTAVPHAALPLFEAELAETGGASLLLLERSLIASLRKSGLAELLSFPDAAPDLVNRLKRSSSLPSLEEILTETASKQYTRSRARRLILRCFLGLSHAGPPDYLRILAFNDTGRELLRRAQEGALPVITKPAAHKALLAEEALLTNLYSLFAKRPLPAARELTASPKYVPGRHEMPAQ